MMKDVVTYEHSLRDPAIFHLNSVWNLSNEHLEALLDEVKGALKEDEAREHINQSYKLLNAIIRTLKYDQGYHEREDPSSFKTYIDNLEDVFAHLFDGCEAEDHIPEGGDPAIDDRKWAFYGRMQKQLNLPSYVTQSYSPITQLIRFVRNNQKHSRSRPIDHATGAESYGNIYTLTSIIILAIYAYTEILEVWLKALKKGKETTISS